MRTLLSVAALSFIVASACLAQSPAPAPDRSKLAAYVNHLMDVHIGVERTAPTGWSITVKPVAVQREENGTVSSQVHIFVTGAPAGTMFEQQSIAVGEDAPKAEMGGISVGKDGILMCAGRTSEQCGDSKNPDDPIEFTTMSSLKGEPYRFLFVSDAGTVGTVFVMNPVGNRNKGCTLSAVRLTPAFEVALITGVGFAPNTEVHYTATPGSDGEKTMHSDALGVVRFSLMPYAKPGQKSGTITVKINEKQCSPEVSYDWGKT